MSKALTDRQRTAFGPGLLLGAGAILLASAVAFAAEPTLATAGAAPEELSPEVRAVLAGEGTGVAGDDVDLAFWLRSELPVAAAPSAAFGRAFGKLREGALLGAVRVAEPWTDYRGRTVSPGVYTLRYAVRPEDGYHMGVSEYQDFLLLLPADHDADPTRELAYDEMVETSRASSSSNHPAVLALFPVDAPETPAVVDNSWGQPTLALALGDLTLGLVIEGTGEV